MPTPFGTIVNEREPESGSDSERVNESEKRSPIPENLYGFETYEPATERIQPGGIKLTKSGKPDRRTKQYRGTDTDSDAGAETGKVHLSKLDIGELLFSIYLTISEFTKTPELELDKDEAKEYGAAVKEYAKFYGMSFDPKKVALFNLCLVIGKIHIPRVIAIKNRVAHEPQPAHIPAAATSQSKPNGKVQEISLSGMAPSDLWMQGGGGAD